jgi:integrase
MRGYVAKKNNTYYAVIYEGIDPTTGKEKRRWIKGGPRKRDAEDLVTELAKRFKDGETVVPDKSTLGAYLVERWLPIQESKVRASTFSSYERNIELHVVPALGRCPLDKLTADDLDAFYRSLLKSGNKAKGRSSRGLAPKSVRNIHLMLNKALRDAHRKGLVVRNVAALADPPSVNANRRQDLKAWEASQLREFLGAIRSHRLWPAYHVVAHTGMRRGEILGLRWSDVDLPSGRLSVRRALVSVAYQVNLSDVKTATGRRTIDIDPGTVAVFEEWLATRTNERRGKRPEADDLIFVKADGNWVHPDIFSQTFDRNVARLDVPVITLHDLRHTHATLLLKAGVPVKVVSERLGHANVAFTMSVYQHVLPGMQAEAAATFAELLFDDGNGDKADHDAESPAVAGYDNPSSEREPGQAP